MPCISATTTAGEMLCIEPAIAVTSGPAAVPFIAAARGALVS